MARGELYKTNAPWKPRKVKENLTIPILKDKSENNFERNTYLAGKATYRKSKLYYQISPKLNGLKI